MKARSKFLLSLRELLSSRFLESSYEDSRRAMVYERPSVIGNFVEKLPKWVDFEV